MHITEFMIHPRGENMIALRRSQALDKGSYLDSQARSRSGFQPPFVWRGWRRQMKSGILDDRHEGVDKSGILSRTVLISREEERFAFAVLAKWAGEPGKADGAAQGEAGIVFGKGKAADAKAIVIECIGI